MAQTPVTGNAKAATPTTSRVTPSTAQQQPPPSQRELERVREIILGPERARPLLQGAEVDRLRQVLFGAQMEEYERRFADLQREMERVLTDLRLVQDSVSDFEKSLTKRVETMEIEMRRSNDELRRELSRMQTLGTRLQQLAARVQRQELFGQELVDRIQELRDLVTQHERDLSNFKVSVTEQYNRVDHQLAAVKHEMRQAEDTLRAELRRLTDRLDDQKTDRKALAAMLMEVATRLETGSSVTGLLEGLSATAEETSS